LQKAPTRDIRRRGHAVLEVALLSPWLFFLFVGAVDIGFYTHALVATQSAARAAALYTSTHPAIAADSAGACNHVKLALAKMPNTASFNANCTAAPLVVTAASVPSGPDGQPATRVTVNYTTVPLVPIPGLIPSSMTLRRTVEVRVTPDE
jgi:Flp pilus assembly protein TadG